MRDRFGGRAETEPTLFTRVYSYPCGYLSLRSHSQEGESGEVVDGLTLHWPLRAKLVPGEDDRIEVGVETVRDTGGVRRGVAGSGSMYEVEGTPAYFRDMQGRLRLIEVHVRRRRG